MDANEREFVLSMEQNDLILRAFPDHYKVAQLHSGMEMDDVVFEGIKQDLTGPLVLSPQIGTGKKGDMPDGFTKIWQSKGLRPPPSPLSFSPPSSSDSLGGFEIQLQEPSPTEATPPPKVASASTTWSFLEWYGIHPESPGKQVISADVKSVLQTALGPLQNLKVTRASLSGGLLVHAKADPHADVYHVQMAFADPSVEANWSATIEYVHCNRIELTGLTPQKLYYVRLRAFNKNGNGLWVVSPGILVL